MTRVLIADDHPIMLSGIDSLLASTGYEVVARVMDGSDVIEAIDLLRPDIAILDISMPGLSGIDVLRQLRDRGDKLKVVLLTAQIEDDDLLEVMRIGTEGIVLKNGGERLLIQCLDRVAAGGHWIGQDMLIRTSHLRRVRETDPLYLLTSREREIVDLVSQGRRNRSIASELNLTEGTVKVYLVRIYEKLAISSRTELILKVHENSRGDGPSAPRGD